MCDGRSSPFSQPRARAWDVTFGDCSNGPLDHLILVSHCHVQSSRTHQIMSASFHALLLATASLVPGQSRGLRFAMSSGCCISHLWMRAQIRFQPSPRARNAGLGSLSAAPCWALTNRSWRAQEVVAASPEAVVMGTGAAEAAVWSAVPDAKRRAAIPTCSRRERRPPAENPRPPPGARQGPHAPGGTNSILLS